MDSKANRPLRRTAEGSVRDVVGAYTAEEMGRDDWWRYTPGPPHPSSPLARLLQRVTLFYIMHPAIN